VKLGALKQTSKMPKKSEKKQNALKHGAYSSEVMLPGEKPADYQALSAAHQEEWAPDGVTEQCLVEDLVALRWKKQRIDRYDQICLQQRVAKLSLENEYNRHRHRLKNLGPEFSKASGVDAAHQILSRLSPTYVEIIKSWIPMEKCKDPAEWSQEIGKFLSNLKLDDPLEGPDLFAAMVNPHSMEIEISRSERLDEAIDRKIKRLMQVKTAKQIFPNMRKNARPEPKLVSPPPNAAEQPQVIVESSHQLEIPEEIMIAAELGADVADLQPNSVLIEGTQLNGRSPVSDPPAPAEKEHSEEELVKVEVSAKPKPLGLSEWQEFIALVDKLRDQHGYSRGVGLAGCI
jgi:hypothetical protein